MWSSYVFVVNHKGLCENETKNIFSIVLFGFIMIVQIEKT